MATFIVIPLDSSISDTLGKTISEKCGKQAYALPRGEWLVSYNGTTRQLYEEISLDGSFIVLNFAGYWGVAPQDVWEWIGFSQSK